MLPVGISKAGSDPPIKIGAMAGYTNLGVNLLPTYQIRFSTGKKRENLKKSY